MRKNSFAPHYAISRYSIREFKIGAEPFMVAMIIIIIIIKLLRQSPNTIKDAFVHLGGKLAELPNTQRDTVAREIIRTLK